MRLIDADALMEGITTWQKDLEKEYGWHDAYVQCLDGVISSIESASTVNPWHRVEEPPKEEGKYLVYDGRGIYHVAWWGPRLGWCYDPKFFCYWMPMPEPPKEENDGN